MDPDAEPTPPLPRSRSAVGSIVLAIALTGSIGVGWRVAHPPAPATPKPVFCTADGYLLTDGTMLHRDNDQHCAWVDPDGHRVPVDADGRPTG